MPMPYSDAGLATSDAGDELIVQELHTGARTSPARAPGSPGTMVFAMSEKLHATIQRNEAGLSVKLTGVIDEDNRLVELADKVSTGRALIDLGDVERINSCGTRDWVNWIAELEARGIQPVLVECSPAIVAQLNLVKNFA